jgi:hypothetical protein
MWSFPLFPASAAMTSVSKVESSGSGVTMADQAPPSRRIYVAASLFPSVAGNRINRWCRWMEFLQKVAIPDGNIAGDNPRSTQ